jgi:outer membrane lipase/esterase
MLSMKFSVMNWRAGALRATSAMLFAAVLAGCGGGDQVEPFKPERVIAFGDELSVLDTSTGVTRKHTVNALTSGAIDCALNPLWIQYLASAFSQVFSECNPSAATTTSDSRAQAGARVSVDVGSVASVESQIDDFLATNSFNAKTLVTVLAGQHDVLAEYARVVAGTASEADATAAVDAAGAALAGQVNRIAAAGGKVIVSTIPNVGQTPFGVAENTATAGRAALLSRLTAAFNSRMRVGLTNDGRMIGLILLDESIDSIARGNSGFVNVTTPACNVADLLTCTNDTLVATGAASTYLWAGPLQLTPEGQRLLGTLAVARAQGNPF